MMKKWLAVGLALFMACAAFSGCHAKDERGNPEKDKDVSLTDEGSMVDETPDAGGETTESKNDEEETLTTMMCVILEAHDTYLLVKPFEGSPELKCADQFTFGITDLEIPFLLMAGGVITVTYDGYIMETYPAQIHAVAVDRVGSSPDKQVRAVNVDGILYVESGPAEYLPTCGTMDGEITMEVYKGSLPTESGQSNFGTGYRYQFYGDLLNVLIDGEWITFSPDTFHVYLDARDITPDGMTLIIGHMGQDGANPSGDLMTGSKYWVESYDHSNRCWVELPKLSDEIVWTAIAYNIAPNSSSEMQVDFTGIYGSLAPGYYRIGKEIMELYAPGEYQIRNVYFEFEITA